LKTNVLASTGLLKNHFVIDARLSKITSDGFIDRAASDLKSFYLSGGWYHKNSFIRLNVFSGKEMTYQAWEGVPESAAKGDAAGLLAYADRNYLDEQTLKTLQERGRKFNTYTYKNQVDNYQQDHYQLISSFKINQYWTFNPTLHYTYGRGYYEQFKADESLKNYGLANLMIGNDTIKKTDLIRRKWLDNQFYGGVYSFDYQSNTKISGTIGGGWNKYDGKHFGEIIWAKYAPEIGYRWYESSAQKTDFNIYGKAFYQLTKKFNIFADLQIRNVKLEMKGIGDKRQNISQKADYQFFNPKIGVNYVINAHASAYGSYAIGNKEPSRQDFVDNPTKVPNAETLRDLEVGYRLNTKKINFEANYYWMNYKNQLVLTGQVNNVGEAIRTNVAKSYRTGLELSANYQCSKWLVAANMTLSQNKIQNFSETIPSYDEVNPTQVNQLKNTDISFSPNIIIGGQITYLPLKNFQISLLPKYVGKQFLDNTANENRKLDAFFVNDLRINYTIKPKFLKEIELSLLINNIFNEEYESNGYTYSYIYESLVTENFLYPQAGTNVLAAVRIRF
jgi:iron complex outermembrane receptor protein